MKNTVTPACSLMLLSAIVALLALLTFGQTEARSEDQLLLFLEQHCLDCHSGDHPEGGLNLRTTSDDFSDAEVRRR